MFFGFLSSPVSIYRSRPHKLLLLELCCLGLEYLAQPVLIIEPTYELDQLGGGV
jgi:hypothetical protein